MSATAGKPQIETLFRRIVKEETAPLYELLEQVFDGIRTIGEGQKRLEAELTYRRRLDERRARLEKARFDPVGVLEVLKPCREGSSVADPDYVRRTFSELGSGKIKTVSGARVTRLVSALGLDPVDVDEALRVAEVTR